MIIMDIFNTLEQKSLIYNRVQLKPDTMVHFLNIIKIGVRTPILSKLDIYLITIYETKLKI